MGDERVQIKVRRATREELKKHGRKGQTYDDIIQALLQAETLMPDVTSMDSLPIPLGVEK